MSSPWAPSNVYIVNIRHKSFQYGINVRGNIQIKMFQRSSQITVRFTNRSPVFGFFLPWSRADILINVDMTPTKRSSLWIRSFTETKSPHFLHPLSNDRLSSSVWGAGPCNIIHTSAAHGSRIVCCNTHLHILSMCPALCPALHDYSRSATKYLRRQESPVCRWEGGHYPRDNRRGQSCTRLCNLN